MSGAISPFSWGGARRNTPQYYTGYMTFQAGIPNTRFASLTGGGNVPVRYPTGTFAPLVHVYGSRISSAVGPGLFENNPLRLSSLLTAPGSRSTIGG